MIRCLSHCLPCLGCLTIAPPGGWKPGAGRTKTGPVCRMGIVEIETGTNCIDVLVGAAVVSLIEAVVGVEVGARMVIGN